MSDAAILKVIESRCPDLAAAVKSDLTPLATDISRIPAAYEVYRLRTIYPGDDAMNKLVFVACMARIYHPPALYVTLTNRKGLNNQIAKCFGNCTGRNISYYLNQARHYYKNVVSFREKVDQLSREL